VKSNLEIKKIYSIQSKSSKGTVFLVVLREKNSPEYEIGITLF
jgi:hypothetical protein